MPSAVNFLSDMEKDKIVDAIRNAEMNTTGEIRIHLDEYCPDDAYERAVETFHRLNMDQTPFRNAVLIYIAVKDRKFSIVGDVAVNEKVSKDFWHNIIEQMQHEFRLGHYCNGMVLCIHKIGDILASHFPDLDNYNKNELSDDISFS